MIGFRSKGHRLGGLLRGPFAGDGAARGFLSPDRQTPKRRLIPSLARVGETRRCYINIVLVDNTRFAIYSEWARFARHSEWA
jgi:hypothetical protein